MLLKSQQDKKELIPFLASEGWNSGIQSNTELLNYLWYLHIVWNPTLYQQIPSAIQQQIVKTPTPTQHNTTVGFDMKITVQTTPPTHPHRNFSATSRPARELKFGTDIH